MKKKDHSLKIITLVLIGYVLLAILACAKITEKRTFQKEAASILQTPDLSIHLPNNN